MAFKFTWLCELFADLEKNRHKRLASSAKVYNPDHDIIRSWFTKYDGKIRRVGSSGVALLSALFPEQRVDRVYNLQESRLSAIIGRSLGLGHGRAETLNQWREKDGEDFATCVARVMAQCECDLPPAGREVTLEEIDLVLDRLAAKSPFSSSVVKRVASPASANELLTPILRRLQSWEAKWFVRMLLKTYMDIQIPARLVQTQFHFMLPHLLAVQNSFEAAVEILGRPTIVTLPARPSIEYEKALRSLLSKEILPQLGTMIRRQPYYKARSIKHCCHLALDRRMSVERKYDGEYCQVHINLSKGEDCIQIFSKSGKDSTQDRSGIHRTIKDGLKIGQKSCSFNHMCIIEGELLVWSSRTQSILPFHKIRKYVKHGGKRIGCVGDSPLRSDENLMIVMYDVLLVDSRMLLSEPHTNRRRHLKGMTKTIPGRCVLAERQTIDFSTRDASTKLRNAFAQAITQCWEGLVLKPCAEAYHSWNADHHGIKLKKDYILGLGDTADLCIIGGRRDANVETALNAGPLQWTSFHLGCLSNKEEVLRFNAKPRLRILDEVTHHSMSHSDLLDLNALGVFRAVPFGTDGIVYDIEPDKINVKPPTDLFKEPFIIEIMGAGFHKPSNCSYYTLRFPRKVGGAFKLHLDRSIVDSTDFRELQIMAEASLEPVNDVDPREHVEWTRRLLQADGRSQSSYGTSEQPSPRVSSTTSSPASIASNERSRKKIPLLIRVDSEGSADEGDISEMHSTTTDSRTTTVMSPTQLANTYRRGSKRAREVLGDISPLNIARKRLKNGGTGYSIQPAEEIRAVVDVVGDKPALGTARCQSQAKSLNVAFASAVMEVENVVVLKAIPEPLHDGGQLPTPPSSGQEALSEQPTTRRLQRNGLTALKAVNTIAPKHSTDIVDRVYSRLLGDRERSACLVYLPPSVIRHNVVEVLYKQMSRFQVRYTHLAEAFVDSLEFKNSHDQGHRSTIHIVLLDFEQPESSKEDLDELFQYIMYRLDGTDIVPIPPFSNKENCRENLQQSRRPLQTENFPSTSKPSISKFWFEDGIMLWDYSVFGHMQCSYRRKPKMATNDGITATNPPVSSAHITKENEAKHLPTTILPTSAIAHTNLDYQKLISTNMAMTTAAKETTTCSQGQIRIKTRNHLIRENDDDNDNGNDDKLEMNLQVLSRLQHDPKGSELFAGFIRLHRRTLLEQGKWRYCCVKSWDWN